MPSTGSALADGAVHVACDERGRASGSRRSRSTTRRRAGVVRAVDGVTPRGRARHQPRRHGPERMRQVDAARPDRRPREPVRRQRLARADTRSRACRERDRERIRRDEIGLVFQADNLLPFLTALENVALPARVDAERDGGYRALGRAAGAARARRARRQAPRPAVGRTAAARGGRPRADPPAAHDPRRRADRRAGRRQRRRRSSTCCRTRSGELGATWSSSPTTSRWPGGSTGRLAAARRTAVDASAPPRRASPMRSYVWRELVRNPRRTLAATGRRGARRGPVLGVLFFIDGSGATLTARAIAPLAIDMQRVLTSPLGGGLRLEERIGPAGSIARRRAGHGHAARDQRRRPSRRTTSSSRTSRPPPLRYVPGTATLNGARAARRRRRSPFSQGVAGLGRNIGTVAPGATVTITYRARAGRAVRARRGAAARPRLEPREPRAGARERPRALTLEQVRRRIAAIPGVAAADGLAFADLPAGSLRARGVAVPGPVRVFAFDRRYRDHYPSIRVVAGSFRPGPRCSAPRPRARSGSGRAGRCSCASRRPRASRCPSAAWPISREPGRSSRAAARARSRSSSTCRSRSSSAPPCSRTA